MSYRGQVWGPLLYRVTLERGCPERVVRKVKVTTAGFTAGFTLCLGGLTATLPLLWPAAPSLPWSVAILSLPPATIPLPKVEGVDRAPGSQNSQSGSLPGSAVCESPGVCRCVSPAQLGRRACPGITPRPPSRRRHWTSPSEASVSCKVLTTFYNLRNLNLHGNSIQQLSEVDKLAVLPHLRNLTLHGNPIEEEKGYRSYVLSTLPQLKNFDFSGVTKLDRSTAAVWRRMNIKPKVIRKKRERY
uniref:Leucine-rich repeat-containing protein 51 n=1 Tax=Laticauda laticaudata TaxID=8630 RepID=A0A8C5S0V3_LATLA